MVANIFPCFPFVAFETGLIQPRLTWNLLVAEVVLNSWDHRCVPPYPAAYKSGRRRWQESATLKSNMRQISPQNLAARGEEHLVCSSVAGSSRVEDSKTLSAIVSTDGIGKTAPMQCLKGPSCTRGSHHLETSSFQTRKMETHSGQAWSLMHTSTLHPCQCYF